jgi:hypothetical protein
MCNNSFNDKTGVKNSDYQIIISGTQDQLITNNHPKKKAAATFATTAHQNIFLHREKWD